MAEYKWINLKDCLPPMRMVLGEEGDSNYFISDYVLVALPGWKPCVVVARAEISRSGFMWDGECGINIESDFWMPLPPMPEEVRDDG